MTIDSTEPDKQPFYHIRLYGGCCIAANILLGIKGVALHDVFLIGAGFGTALAQGANLTRGEAARPLSIPAILLACIVFAVGGAVNSDQAQLAFGAIKAVGVTTLFYGKQIMHSLTPKIPGLRLREKLPVTNRVAGMLILDGAALSLGIDGYHKISQGLGAHEHAALVNGMLTMGATIGLFVGQLFACLAPHQKPLAGNKKGAPFEAPFP